MRGKHSSCLVLAVNGNGAGLPTALPWGLCTMKGNSALFSMFVSHKSQPHALELSASHLITTEKVPTTEYGYA